MNSTTVEPQLHYAVLYGSIMFIGLSLNAIAIWILLHHHSLKSPNVIFMLNLAISDLLLACSLPLRVYFHATGSWPFGAVACIAVAIFFLANFCSSSIFITFISIDRLLAVVYPLRSRHIRTARNAAKAVILTWIFVVLTDVPFCIKITKLKAEHNDSSCFIPVWYKYNPDFIFVRRIFQFILVLVMLTVNVVSSILVSLTLRRNVKDQAKLKNKVNVMLLFVMNIIMFTVCFLPVTIARLFIRRDQTYLHCLAVSNCCLDPLLYYFSLDAFWKKKEERNQLKVRDIKVTLEIIE